jgi:hypothetical protein
LYAAQRLSREDVQFDPDERPSVRVEDAVRGGGAAEPVGEEPPRVPDALNLGILAERVGQLQVPGLVGGE